MKNSAATAVSLSVPASACAQIGIAQVWQAIQIKRIASPAPALAGVEHFTGPVRIDPLSRQTAVRQSHPVPGTRLRKLSYLGKFGSGMFQLPGIGGYNSSRPSFSSTPRPGFWGTSM